MGTFAGRNVFPEPAYQTPPGSPSATAGMDVFSPPTSNAVAGVGPVIAEMTRQGRPNEAISIATDNGAASFYPLYYAQTNNSDGWRLGDKAQNLKLRVSPDTKMNSWSIPANLPDNSAILVVPITPQGAGTPWMLNLPQPDFVASEDTGYNACFAGGTVRVMGKSLCKAISSQTVNTIGTGTFIFQVPQGCNFTVGDNVYVVATSAFGVVAGANYMKGTITVYNGTNLTLNITSQTGSGTFLYWKIYDTGYTNVWLSVAGQQAYQTVIEAHPWQVRFTLGDGSGKVGSHTLTAGDVVQVWINNSMGGNTRGWVQCPMSITVATPTSLSMNYTNVSGTGSPGSPLNPSGDTTGATDLANLQGIINTQTVPSRIWLNSGNFYFNAQIFMGGHFGVAISLMGQGIGSTVLNAASGSVYNSSFMQSSNAVLSEINSLTINVSGNTTFTSGGGGPTIGVAAIARIVNSEITALNSKCNCVLAGGFSLRFRCYVVNSALTGEFGIFSGGTDSLYCDNTDSFICDGDVDGASAMHCYCLANTPNIVVTNCTSQNYNLFGPLNQRGNGKFVDATDETINNYIAENVTIGLSPQSGDGFLGTGEQVAYEMDTSTAFSANIISTAVVGGVTTITYASYTGPSIGHAFVADGKGKYQTANVTSISVNTLTLNKLLAVTLDTTSVVQIIRSVSEATVVLNTFNGFNTSGSSSMGWTLFGAATNCCFQHNTVTSTAFGFAENFYNLNGSVLNALGGWNLHSDNSFTCIEGEQQVVFAGCGWGNIYRNNLFACTQDYLLLHVGSQYPSNEGNVFDNSYYSGAPNVGQASNFQAAPATFLLWNTQMWGNNTGPAWNGANAANYNVHPLGTSKLRQFTSGNQP
jgi:hypothetical protein